MRVWGIICFVVLVLRWRGELPSGWRPVGAAGLVLGLAEPPRRAVLETELDSPSQCSRVEGARTPTTACLWGCLFCLFD